MQPYPKPEPRPKKLPQPLKRTPLKKKPVKIRHFTPERAALERQKTNTYKALSEEKPPYCEGCGSREFEHSHRISQNSRSQIANPKNLDRYCRSCHCAYESGRIYCLDNGIEVMQFLKETDYQRYMAKAFKMRERIEESRLNVEDLPGWVQEILLEIKM